MKTIFIYSLFIVCFTAFAQHTNDNDKKVKVADHNTKQIVYFKLNTEWFVPKETILKSYVSADGQVEIWGPTITPVTLKEAIKNVKDQKISYKLLQNSVIKTYEEYSDHGTNLISIAYGKPSDDGKLLSMLIIMPKEYMKEWELYFDNVASSLSLAE